VPGKLLQKIMSKATHNADGTPLTLAEKVQDYVLHHVQDASSWHIGGIDIPLPSFMSLHAATSILVAVLLIYVFGFRMKKTAGVPTGLSNALEALVLFVRNDIAYAYLGKEDGRKMAPTLLTFFFFILSLNLIGLIPGFAGVTGNFSVTAALAICVLFFMTVGAIIKNGPSGFFHAFIPHGVPIPVLFLITPLELLGVLVKSFVLALRLCANLLAGHIVLFTILGLIVTFGAASSVAFVPLGLFVFFLEILVAFLQAYVFTTLSAMFIGQIYHPEH